MNFANDILDAIEIMVKQVVEDNVTKIYTGVCKTIGVNNCVLTINGKDNTVKYYGGVPVVGTVYQVFIPFGNMSAAFIIVPGSGGGSGGSGVDSVNGKTGDVVLNASDVGALPNTTTIPSKTSQLTNDSGYITKSSAPVKSVDGKTGAVVTNAVKTTQQSLTDAQKSQARINIGAGTSSFDGNYNSLSGKPTIPSNTSQLNNDSGFITSESAPVKSVNGKTGDVVLTATDVNALPSSTTIPTKTSQLTNDSEFITLAQVPTAPVQSVNGQTGAVVIDEYSLPTASDTVLGGIKVGSGLTINSGGVLSATGGGVADAVEWDNVQSKPTTISGYGITDAKIDNGAIILGDNRITPVTSVNGQTGDVTISAELPENLVQYDVLGEVEPTQTINADTLQGHAANYFATATDVSKLQTDVSNLQIEQENINTSLSNKQETIIKQSVTFSTDWIGDASPYSQIVTISSTTANSKVDLQPDVAVIQQMIDDGTVALQIVNDDGTLTAYAVGEKPTVELIIQVTITEVNV